MKDDKIHTNIHKIYFENIGSAKTILMLMVIFYHCIRIWAPYGWHGIHGNESKLLSYLVEWIGNIHTQSFTFISEYIFYYV